MDAVPPFAMSSFAKPSFANELLAFIALGLRGTASLGRREGSRSSPQGVFATAEPRQKRLKFACA